MRLAAAEPEQATRQELPAALAQGKDRCLAGDGATWVITAPGAGIYVSGPDTSPRKIASAPSRIEAVAVHAAAGLVALAQDGDRVSLLRLDDGASSGTVEGHASPIARVFPYGQGGRVLTVGHDAVARSWNAASPSALARRVLSAPGTEPTGLVAGALEAEAGVLYAWERDALLRVQLERPDAKPLRRPIHAWCGDASALAVHGGLLLVAMRSSQLLVAHDLETLEEQWRLEAPAPPVGFVQQVGVQELVALCTQREKGEDRGVLAVLTPTEAGTPWAIRTLPLPVAGQPAAAALHPSGERCVVATREGKLLRCALRVEAPVQTHVLVEANPTALAYDPAGSRLFVGGAGVDVLDMRGDEPERVARWHGRDGAISALAVSGDGTALFAASQAGALRRWSLTPTDSSALRRISLPEDVGAACSLAADPSGSCLYVGTHAGHVVRAELDGHDVTPLVPPEVPAGQIYRAVDDLRVAANGAYLLARRRNGRYRVVQLPAGRTLGRVPASSVSGRVVADVAGPHGIVAVVTAPRSRRRAPTEAHARLWRYELPSLRELGSPQPLPSASSALLWHPRAEGWWIGALTGSLHELSAGGAFTAGAPRHQRRITDLVPAPPSDRGASRVLSASEDGRIALSEGAQAATKRAWQGRAPLRAAGSRIAYIAEAVSGATPAAIVVHALDDSVPPIRLPDHAGGTAGLCFSPDGRWLATCGGGNDPKDQDVRLWDLAWWAKAHAVRNDNLLRELGVRWVRGRHIDARPIGLR